jgi:hypothetical protein
MGRYGFYADPDTSSSSDGDSSDGDGSVKRFSSRQKGKARELPARSVRVRLFFSISGSYATCFSLSNKVVRKRSSRIAHIASVVVF